MKTLKTNLQTLLIILEVSVLDIHSLAKALNSSLTFYHLLYQHSFENLERFS